MPFPALLDEEYLAMSRLHIMDFLRPHLEPKPTGRVLEIGPKIGWPGFDTLDINEAVKATYTADICDITPISNSTYDIVLAISILEHVVNPFAAIHEIRRILKPGGLLLAQAPYNFRIHGPLPDLWRFTEHGWRLMLKDWDDVEIKALEAPERVLAPIAYTASARCNKIKEVDPDTLEWRWIP